MFDPTFSTAGAGAVRPAGTGEAVVLHAKIPADVDAPDRVAFDLTFRQLTVLTTAGMLGLSVWILTSLAVPALPVVARAVVLVPIAGAALALAVGRRDGLSLDLWLAEAAVFKHRPHRLAPVPVHEPPPWAPAVTTPPDAPGRRGRTRTQLVGLLELPADAVDDDGTIRHRHGQAGAGRTGTGRTGTATVLVAASTMDVALRTPAEQAALVAGLGRWLNGLTGDVQIVVSARRVDLAGHATRLIDRAQHLVDPGGGLAAAAADHAAFLLDLAEICDPLARTVTIAATASGGPSPATAARRTAEHTVTALTALGARASVLDGATATAVLAAAADPYQATDPGLARTRPGSVVTGQLSTLLPTEAWEDEP